MIQEELISSTGQPVPAEILKEIEDKLRKRSRWVPVENVFCPTGSGGGIDPTCSPGNGSVASALESVTKHTGYTREQLKKGLATDLVMRARVAGSILLGNTAVKNAVHSIKLPTR